MRMRIWLALFVIFILGFLIPVSAFSQEPAETQAYQKGSTLCIQGKWAEAADAFEDLLKKYPRTSYTDARFWLGFSYVEMGKLPQGISFLDRFATDYPHSSYAPQALYKMGEVYERKLRDYDKALKTYDRIADLYPKNNAAMPAMQNQAIIYSQRKYDYERAIEKLEESKFIAQKQGLSPQSEYVAKADQRIAFIKQNSDYDYEPLKIFAMGMNKEEDKRWNEAVGIYDVLLSKYPRANIADDADYRKIMCLLKMNKNKDAMAMARKFLDTYPRSPYQERVRTIIMNINSPKGDFFRREQIYFV